MTTRSQQWFERAQQSLVEGVNSPSRGAAVYSPGPLLLERGHGSHVWDTDGNEYIDFMMSFGALIQGHAHPKLVEVVSRAMAEGSHFAAATSAEVEAAERLSAAWFRPPRWCASPTAAAKPPCWPCAWLALTPGGRSSSSSKGHYHGWYDPNCLNGHSHPPDQLGSRRIPESPSGLGRHSAFGV